eukprot:scaffold266722_cov20-Tisochrysis_lutea.AAC.2
MRGGGTGIDGRNDTTIVGRLSGRGRPRRRRRRWSCQVVSQGPPSLVVKAAKGRRGAMQNELSVIQSCTCLQRHVSQNCTCLRRQL